MADLTGQQLKNSYQNLVTIDATIESNPTSGQLENGLGNPITALGIGTDSPASPLTISRTNQLGSNEYIRLVGSSGSLTFGVYPSSGNSFSFIGSNTNYTGGGISRIDASFGGSLLALNKDSIIAYVSSGVADPTEAMRIDSSGNVGIGGTPGDGYRLQLLGDSEAGNTLGMTYFGVGASAIKVNSSGALEFGVDASDGSTERMRILSSGGITFNGDTATANALDDYEEGTWSPVYAPSSGSFTTMTMDVSSATYTKIGRQVTVRAFIFTDDVDATGASGSLRISGLPFASAGSGGGRSAVSVGFVNDWVTAPDSGIVEDAQSHITLRKTNATASSQVSDLTTGANADKNEIILTATYFV